MALLSKLLDFIHLKFSSVYQLHSGSFMTLNHVGLEILHQMFVMY
jgi:hypothetical protein